MQSFWTPLRVGLVVALAVAAFGFGLYLIGADKFGANRTYNVYAVFDDATRLLQPWKDRPIADALPPPEK